MVMRVDHIAHRHAQFLFDKGAHGQRLLRERQRINHHRPLRTGDCAGSHLRVYFTLKPINIFRDTFALHSASLPGD